MRNSRSSEERSSNDEEFHRGPTRDSETRKSKRSKEKVRVDVARESGSTAEPKSAEVVSTSLGIDNKIGEMGIPVQRGWRYILKHLTLAPNIQCRNKVPNSEEQLQRNSETPRNHQHCYGWIGSDKDEEQGDFIYLSPAAENIEAKATTTPNLSNRTRNRKSRWDV